MTKELNSNQRNEIAQQFAELVVDGMDIKTMEQYIFDNMMEYFSKLTADELEEEVYNHDEELWEELVDNVTSKSDVALLTMNTDNLPDIDDNEADGITDDDIFIDINNTGGKY